MSVAAPPIAPESLYRYGRVAPTVASPYALTQADIAAYHNDGFLAVENVLTPDELATAREGLADLLYGRVATYKNQQPEPEHKEKWDEFTAHERGDLTRKLFKFVEFSPVLKSLAVENATIQGILRRLLGENADLIQDMALLKPPFVGTEKPWHQDMAYFGWGPPEKLIGVWIALDAATAENGCMHVLPGTHKDGPVAHTHQRDCQIPDERVQVERDVLTPLAPGGALFFSALLHHGTPPNNSPNRRWALQYHYKAVSAHPISHRQHADLYFDGDMYAGCRGKMGEPVTRIEP